MDAVLAGWMELPVSDMHRPFTAMLCRRLDTVVAMAAAELGRPVSISTILAGKLLNWSKWWRRLAMAWLSKEGRAAIQRSSQAVEDFAESASSSSSPAAAAIQWS